MAFSLGESRRMSSSPWSFDGMADLTDFAFAFLFDAFEDGFRTRRRGSEHCLGRDALSMDAAVQVESSLTKIS